MNGANKKAQRCCPEDSILEQWVRGRLDESTEATLVAHCDQCERCEARLEDFERSLPVDRDLRACAYSPSLQDASSSLVASIADSLPRSVDRLPEISGFQIIREIGRGGMGIVYEADQPALGRRVALKLLPREFNQDETLVRRFESEAKAAAGFHHSNIVPVFQVGCEGDSHFFTMQLIDGVGFDKVILDLQNESNATSGNNKSIHARVVDGLTLAADSANTILIGNRENTEFADGASPHEVTSRLSSASRSTITLHDSKFAHFVRRVAIVGSQIADALDYAHDRGVIHRDVKPSNLLLDTNGVPWVTDFGLAKTQDVELTQTGAVLGTIRYMSQERFAGSPCDERGDVYSLGATLYELAVQRPAFPEADHFRAMNSISRGEAPTLRSIDPRIPIDFQTIIHKAMHREPDRRYPTCKDLSDDLTRFASGQPIRARRVGSLEKLWLWSKQYPSLAASLAVTALLLTVGAVASTVAAFHFRAQEQVQSGLVREIGVGKQNTERQRDEAFQNAYFADVGSAYQDWRVGQIRRMLTTLRRYIPDGTSRDIRGWEWYFLAGLADQSQRTVFDHEDAVIQVAWSKDGERLFSASDDGTFRVWNGQGDQIGKIEIASIRQFVLSPDELTVATIDGTSNIKIWDLETLELARTLSTKFTSITCMDGAADGERMVVSGLDGSDQKHHVIVVHNPSGKTLSELGHTESLPVKEVKFSPDGTRIGVVNNYTAHVWVWQEQLRIELVDKSNLPMNEEALQGLQWAWHPSEFKFVVGTQFQGTYLFEQDPSDSQQFLARKLDASHGAYVVEFSKDGSHILVGGRDQMLKLFKTENLKLVETYRGHLGWIRSASWQPTQDSFASASDDGTIKIWQLRPDKIDLHQQERHGMSPDGKWKWRQSNRETVISDSATHQVVMRHRGNGPLAFYPHGNYLLFRCSRGNDLWAFVDWFLYDTKSWGRVAISGQGNGFPKASKAGDYFAWLSSDENVTLFNLKTRRRRSVKAHSRGSAICLSPSGRHLATVSYGEVKIWDTTSCQEIGSMFHESDKYMPYVSWDHGGRFLVTSSADQTVCIWDTRQMKCHRVLRGHVTTPEFVAFSHDDARLVSVGTKRIRIWDVESGRQLLAMHRGDFVDFYDDSLVDFQQDPAGVKSRAEVVLQLAANAEGVHVKQEDPLLACRRQQELAQELMDANRGAASQAVRALNLATKALNTKPDDIATRLTLAEAQCRNALWKEARENALEVNTLSKQSSMRCALILALSNSQLGDDQSAEEWFHGAVAAQSDPAKIPQNAQWLFHEVSKSIHKPDRSVSTANGIVVTTLEDELNGLEEGGVSLREAILYANDEAEITFSVHGTIQLRFGEIIISKPLRIVADPQSPITIDARSNSRIFFVDDRKEGTLSDVGLDNLKLINGYGGRTFDEIHIAGGSGCGGAIYNRERLSMRACQFTTNSAGHAGALFLDFGSRCSLSACEFVGNDARRFSAVYSSGEPQGTPSTLSLTDCTFTRNTVDTVFAQGNLSIRNSTFHDNGSGNFAAITSFLRNPGEHLLENCTITNNSGGAVRVDDASGRLDWPLQITNCALHGNQRNGKPFDFQLLYYGNGLVDKPLVLDHCVVETQVDGITQGNNQFGVDPMLGPLQDHGGPTRTRKPLPGSPLIDAGTTETASSSDFDQRGTGFSRAVDGDADGTPTIDIGAVEYQPAG